MITPIVCFACQFRDPLSNPDYPPEVSATTSDKIEGWIRTTDRRYSPDGNPVWVCPKCKPRIWADEGADVIHFRW